MFIIKGVHLEASCMDFKKDKHRKFCEIMTEILPHLGYLRYLGYFESLLHLSEIKLFSVWDMFWGLRNP